MLFVTRGMTIEWFGYVRWLLVLDDHTRINSQANNMYYAYKYAVLAVVCLYK